MQPIYFQPLLFASDLLTAQATDLSISNQCKITDAQCRWCMICPVSSALLPCITANFRPVGSGCRGKWSMESGVKCSNVSFHIPNGPRWCFADFNLVDPFVKSQDIVSRKEMFFLNLHPVQSGWMINWVWQTALLSTFLTPLNKILLLGRMFLPN